MKKDPSKTDAERSNREVIMSAAQRKSLSIALKMIEERLFLFVLLSERGSYEGIMYRFKTDLSDQEKRAFRSIVERILRQIETLKTRFGLQAVGENLSDQILASATYLWTVLEDEKSKKLKRYGTVHSGLKQELDPALQGIIDDLNELAGLIADAKK